MGTIILNTPSASSGMSTSSSSGSSSSSKSSSSSSSSKSSSSSSSSSSGSSSSRYSSNSYNALVSAMSSGSSGSSSSSSSGSSSGSSTTASFYNPGGVTVSKGSSLNIASGSGGGSNYTSYSSGSLSSKSSSGSLSSGSSSGSGSYTVRLDSYTTGGNSQTYSVTDNATGKTTVTAFAGISPEALAQYDAARGNYSAAAMETAIAKYASDNQLSEKYGDKTGVNYYNWDGWSYNAQTGKVDKPDNAIVSTGTYFLDGNGTMDAASAISSASYNVSNSGGTLTASSSGVSSGVSTGLSVGSGNNQSVGGGGIGGAVLGGVDWVLNGVDSIGEQGIGGQILQTGIEFLAPLDAVRLGEKLAKGEETNFWDYFLAGVDALAFIPVFGWVAKGAKTAIKAAVGIGTVAGGIGQGISEANKLIAEDTTFTDSLENNVIDTMRGDTTIILDKSDTKENVFRSNTSKIIGDSNLVQSAKLTNNQGVVEQQDKDELDLSDALNNVFNGTFYDNPDNYGSVSGGSGVTINTLTSGGNSISDIIERAKPYLPIIGAVVVILIVIGVSKKRRTYG